MKSNSYLMESAEEADRLEKKTSEAQTVAQMELVGLREGMTVLDAGAGTGAVARTMAKLVGPSGRAVALDRARERLDAGLALSDGLSNLEFLEGDLLDTKLPSEEFDLTWCRFVFEYLSDPAEALRELARVTARDGKVVVADLDGNGLFHFPMSDRMNSQLAAIREALAGSFDPLIGRKLFNLFRRSAFTDIHTHVLPYHVYAGVADDDALENWAQKFATIRPAAVSAFPREGDYDRFVDEFMGMLKDPDVFTYSVLIIVEGKPPK